MSIFNKDVLINKFSSEEINEKIISYLSSSESIYDVYTVNGYNFNSVYSSFTIKDAVQLFFNTNNIPLEINDIKNLSVYENLEILFNIKKQIHILTKKLIEKHLVEKYEKVSGFEIEMNQHIINLANSFCESLNIKIQRRKNKIYLSLDHFQMIENTNNIYVKSLFTDFMKLKNSEYNDENLDKKINILSSLKNKFDNFFNNKNEYKTESKYHKINTRILKTTWQNIGSHYDKDGKAAIHKDFFDEWTKMSLEEKHIELNNCIETIMILSLINSI